MRTFILMITALISLVSADDKYFEALQYLDGSKGGTVLEKKMPRCPYEKCSGEKTYKYTKKDKKTGYKLLKEIYQDDERASDKALSILLKQIDYKSKKYDDFLTKKLYEDYGLSIEEYKRDVLLFARNNLKSSVSKYKCNSAYLLFKSHTKGYFGVDISLKQQTLMKTKVLESCDKNSFKVLTL